MFRFWSTKNSLSLSPFLSEAVIYAFVIVGLGLTFPLHYIFCVQLFNMKLEEKGDSDLDSCGAIYLFRNRFKKCIFFSKCIINQQFLLPERCSEARKLVGFKEI